MGEGVGTGGFRRRLAIAFVLVAAASAGLVATTSYHFLREERERDFLERSLAEGRLARAFVERTIDGSPDQSGINAITDRFREAAQFDPDRVEAILAIPGEVSPRSGRVTLEDVPSALREPSDTFEWETTTVRGREYLVLATDAGGADLYLFFSREGLRSSTESLLSILSRDWIVVVLLATLIGYILARRTLQPVARSSAAARSLAEGLLDTRLPVEREDEFGALAIAFNEMAAALQEKIEALSAAHQKEKRFTSDVSHELRTPLSGLVSAVSLLRDRIDELDPESRWLSERVIRQVGELRQLVEELLEISRFDEGSAAVQPERLDVARVVTDVVRDLEGSATIDIQSEDREIVTDGRRLQRILANLLDNAFRHGRSPVTVTIAGRDDLITIIVTDEGDGIPPEHRDHLFDRFYKANPARGGGTGLGLAIALENARLLNADLSLDRDRDRGTSFELVLPQDLLNFGPPRMRREATKPAPSQEAAPTTPDG